MSNKGLETSKSNREDVTIPSDLEEIGYRMIENGATAEEATAFVLRSMQARRDVLEREQILEKMVKIPEEATFCEECRNRTRFGLAAALFATKKLTIHAMPSVVDRFKDNYVPISEKRILTLSQINDLMSKIEPSPTYYVLRSLNEINSGRKQDPNFLLIDNHMEVLRKILFYADSMGVNNRNILCEFGLQNLAALRTVVEEWEERKREEEDQ